MKSSTLLIRVVVVVILITGGSHFFSHASSRTSITKTNHLLEIDTDTTSITLQDLKGKWKTTYNTKEFKGAILYEFKLENEKINGYSIEYQDENGYGEKSNNALTLTIHKINNFKGKGIYFITYQGEKHKVKCTIEMINLKKFKLSYDYYGYSDSEIWIKQ